MRTVLVRHADPKQKEWLKAVLKVEVLIDGVLYVAAKDHVDEEHGIDVRSGNVLSLVLKASDPAGPKRYAKYRGVYDALRGLSDVQGTYEDVETPRNRRWHDTLRWMLHVTYGIRTASLDQKEAYQQAGFAALAENLAVRDPGKVVALRRTADATRLTDARGRYNPGRLPLILWSASELVGRRMADTRHIGHAIDRRVHVLATYVDELRRVVQGCETFVRHLHDACPAFFPGTTTRGTEEALQKVAAKEARRLLKGAEILAAIHARPFGSRSFRHMADDLRTAAGHLRVGVYGEARAALHKVLRGIFLLQVMWEMQEALSTLHFVRSRALVLSGTDVERLKAVLEGFVKRLDRDDLDHDFEQPVVADAVARLEEALEALTGYSDRPEHRARALRKADEVHEHLKKACNLF